MKIASLTQPGRGPTVIFLPGFASDMRGSKAEFLAGWCAARAQGFVRFDYSGHGASEGRFEDGTIGRWADDALGVIDAVAGPVVLVGSSMGGWIALLAALARARVVGLVLLAPAPDFTEDLMWAALGPGEQAAVLREGGIALPGAYGAPLVITRGLIEEGRRHLLLRGPIGLGVPVRIVHGQDDADVPWERSLVLARLLEGTDVEVTLVKGAGHRLSAPGELALVGRVLEGVLVALGAGSR